MKLIKITDSQTNKTTTNHSGHTSASPREDNCSPPCTERQRRCRQWKSPVIQIYKLACHLADRYQLAHSEVRQLIFQRWVPPLDAREVKNVLGNVFKRTQGGLA